MRKWLAAVCMLLSCAVHATEHKPNILLIVLDDAGYSDVAGFGRDDAPTPTLRSIANDGVRFTRHYADSTCRPARLALLTGREAARLAQNPDFRGMSPDLVTLPEALKRAGYVTWHIGKWHLGDAVRDAWPDRQGFDHWFGFLNQFQLKGPDENGEFTRRPTYVNPFLQGDGQALQQYNGHLEDILAERVVDAINHADRSKPWFINYWLFAPHHPSTASDEYLKKYPPTPEGKYRALLAQADAEIGKAVDALRRTRQLDNTVIVIVSDNGGTNQMMNNNAPFAGVKGEFREGSLRTPLLIRWPDRRHAGKTIGDIVAIQDIYPTLMHAAGLAPDPSLDGHDLTPLLDGGTLPPRVLVHEIGSVGLFNYGWLSADGRWRATGDGLYALDKDPASTNDVSATDSNARQSLLQQYVDWRAAKILVPLQYQQLSATGQATLIGDDFRRAPGYGAWSFSIGVSGASKPVGQPAFIGWQQNVWSLTFNPDRSFTVQIGTDQFSSSAWSGKSGSEACLPVTLVTWYTRSRLNEGRNTAYLRLYAGTEKLLDTQMANPSELIAPLGTPTWIGQDASGKHAWPGTLSTPRVYNASLSADPAAALDRLDTAQTLACSATNASR